MNKINEIIKEWNENIRQAAIAMKKFTPVLLGASTQIKIQKRFNFICWLFGHVPSIPNRANRVSLARGRANRYYAASVCSRCRSPYWEPAERPDGSFGVMLDGQDVPRATRNIRQGEEFSMYADAYAKMAR